MKTSPLTRRRPSLESLETRIVPILNPAPGLNPAPLSFMPAVCHIIGENSHGTGTLIAPQWVLTAAHVISGTWTEDLRIYINGQTYYAADRFGVIDLVYGFDTRDYEIGLIKLTRAVPDVQPIPIYRSPLSVGQQVIIVGYGRTDNGTFIEQKDTGGVRRAGVSYVDGVPPSHPYGHYTLYQLRFDGGSESFPGRGDSGGPIIVRKNGRYFVAGVTSRLASGGWSSGSDYGSKIGAVVNYIRTDYMGFWIDDVMAKSAGSNHNIRQAHSGRSQEPGVQDVTAPIIVTPGSITRYSTSPQGVRVEFENLTIHDDYDLFPSVVYSHEPGSTFPIGTTIVTVTATDVSGNVRAETFEVIVLPGNPVVIVDEYLVDRKEFEVAAFSGVLANDHSPIGNALRAILNTGPTNGSLTFNEDGSFRYVPNAGFTGVDSFTYFVEDGTHDPVGPIQVTLNVTRPPIIADDSYLIRANQAKVVPAELGVLANDASAYGNVLSVFLVNGVTNGQLTLQADGSFTYVPNEGFAGVDQFTYRAWDGSLLSEEGTVTLTVAFAPIGHPDAYVVAWNRPFSVGTSGGVLLNDSDPGGRSLRVTLENGPLGGSLSLGELGNFVYVPNPGFLGVDGFTYVVHNGLFSSGPIEVSLVVERPPEAISDSWYVYYSELLRVDASRGLLANDVDHYGRPLRVELVTPPALGHLNLQEDGSFTYLPNPFLDNAGEIVFQYRVSNGTLKSDPILVRLNVWGLLAQPDHFTFGFSLLGHRPPPYNGSGLLSNDFVVGAAPSGAEQQRKTELLIPPSHGSIVLHSNGAFTYDSGNYHGEDYFHYRVVVGEYASEPTWVRIVVPPATPRNDRYYSGEFDLWLSVPAEHGLLANDPKGVGAPLQVILTSPVSHGWLNLWPDGSFVWYTPYQGFRGEVWFSYRVTNGTSSSFFTADVRISAGAPIGQPDHYVVSHPSGLSVSAWEGVLANDPTWFWHPHAAEVIQPTAHGTLNFNSDGSFSYSPRVGFTGEDTFIYRAYDWYGSWQPVTVTISTAPSLRWANPLTGDFNGDGIPDQLARLQGTNEWWVTLGGDPPTTNRWLARPNTQPFQHFLVGDLNGDGRDDLLMRAARTGVWLAGLSTGSGFQTIVWTRWAPHLPWIDVRLGDFNGDGKMDLLGRIRTTNQWWVGLSTGTGVQASIWGAWPRRPWTDVRVADVNGDGRDDLVVLDAIFRTWTVGFSNGRNRFLTREFQTDPLIDR